MVKTNYVRKWNSNVFEKLREAGLNEKRLRESLDRKDLIELSPWECGYLRGSEEFKRELGEYLEMV